MSSREMCPLSHLEERGHGFESDWLYPAGSKGAALVTVLSFLGGLVSVSLAVTSGSEGSEVPSSREAGFTLQACEAAPLREFPGALTGGLCVIRSWGTVFFLSCLELGGGGISLSSSSYNSLKPEPNLMF